MPQKETRVEKAIRESEELYKRLQQMPDRTPKSDNYADLLVDEYEQVYKYREMFEKDLQQLEMAMKVVTANKGNPMMKVTLPDIETSRVMFEIHLSNLEFYINKAKEIVCPM